MIPEKLRQWNHSVSPDDFLARFFFNSCWSESYLLKQLFKGNCNKPTPHSLLDAAVKLDHLDKEKAEEEVEEPLHSCLTCMDFHRLPLGQCDTADCVFGSQEK